MISKKHITIGYRQEAQQRKYRHAVLRVLKFVIPVSTLFVGIIWFLFFAHLFDVRTIEVRSPAGISADDIRQKAWEEFNVRHFGIRRWRNALLISPRRIESALLRAFPRADSIDARRTSIHGVMITVKERVPIGLWCLPARGVCYYYDQRGIAFLEVAPSSGFVFVPVRDHRDRTIEIGSVVASAELRENIFGIKQIFQFGALGISEVDIASGSFDEFTVVVTEGWRVLYRQGVNVRQQTNNLLALLNEKMAPAVRANLDYVDLRINDRIYYKEKETPSVPH